MKKLSKKSIALILAVAVLAAAFTAIAGALSVKDSTFYLNTPTYMALNTSMSGHIENQDDYDSYVINVPENGALTVRLDHDNMAESIAEGWRITLYAIIKGETNTYKELTYFESFWSDVTSSWGETGVAPGDYLIVVEPAEFYVVNTYTLIVSFTATDTFEREFNDTPETANEMPVNSGLYGSSSQRTEGNDLDYFKVVMPTDGYLNISFTHSDDKLPSVGWNVSLLSQDLKPISEFSSRYSDQYLSTGDVGVKAGTYYVRVASQVVSGSTYRLTVTSGVIANIEYELNDTPETAVILDSDNSMTGNLSPRILGLDKDYYKISLPSDGCVNVYFTHAKQTDDKKGWNIRVLKEQPDGTFYEVLKRISSWNDGGVSLENLGLSKGDYYILVDADSVSPSSLQYSIWWSYTENEFYEQEPNDTQERAQNITLNTMYYGALLKNDMRFDSDYYRFTLTEDKTVCFDFFHTATEGAEIAWTVSIVDEGLSVISEVECAKNRSVETSAPVTLPAGVYYIAVEPGLYEDTSEYHFRVVD